MIIKRESRTGSNDLHVVYRPRRVGEIVGQETNVRILKTRLDDNKVPHTQLYTGRAGCGKTTAARIMALSLNCKKGVTSEPCLDCESCKAIINGNSIDVVEINVGRDGGKADVENIVRNLSSSPYSSRFKILIFDEAHKLTDGAKDSLLKIIEDGYSHVYFIFCTNQPDKLKGKKKDNPFLDRCSVMSFDGLSIGEMGSLLTNVAEFEGMAYSSEVIKYIAEVSEGVPRKALMLLSQVNDDGNWDLYFAKKIVWSSSEDEDPQIYELSRLLVRGNFVESIKLYDKIKHMNVETVRMTVCGYFVACLKKSRDHEREKFSKVLDILTEPIYDNGKVAEHKFYNLIFKITDIISKY